ncbi:hypothetical protein, partial [Polyangium sp. 15x6]|uniref:hypothetical protein n=1 Tax=Polyangium sp. 15x6 TaxID=3042687 RepID=UPI002499D23A
ELRASCVSQGFFHDELVTLRHRGGRLRSCLDARHDAGGRTDTRVKEAGDQVGLLFVDHVIVTASGRFSSFVANQWATDSARK